MKNFYMSSVEDAISNAVILSECSNGASRAAYPIIRTSNIISNDGPMHDSSMEEIGLHTFHNVIDVRIRKVMGEYFSHFDDGCEENSYIITNSQWFYRHNGFEMEVFYRFSYQGRNSFTFTLKGNGLRMKRIARSKGELEKLDKLLRIIQLTEVMKEN